MEQFYNSPFLTSQKQSWNEPDKYIYLGVKLTREDNRQRYIVDGSRENERWTVRGSPPFRSQEELYKYYKRQVEAVKKEEEINPILSLPPMLLQ